MPRPDYVITKVSYDSDHSRITEVKRGEYDADDGKVRNFDTVPREVVVSAIESGTQYYTAPRDGEGDLEWGDEVEVFEFDGVKFIRTDGNRVEQDNLGDLPEF